MGLEETLVRQEALLREFLVYCKFEQSMEEVWHGDRDVVWHGGIGVAWHGDMVWYGDMLFITSTVFL